MIKIRTVRGDIFQSKCDTLVNTVNCVGVMGKGLALEFKKRYPEMYRDYVCRCGWGLVRPGEPYLWSMPYPPWNNIVNFPTKDHWREKSKIEWIETGLKNLVYWQVYWGIKSIAIPPLGCGNGGLSWEVVRPMICEAATKMIAEVEIYEPQ